MASAERLGNSAFAGRAASSCPLLAAGRQITELVPPGPGHGSRPGLKSGLTHPDPPPFTSGHAVCIRAVRGRWRTLVNAGHHCWKACWGQPLASSNLASSANADLRRRDILGPQPCRPRHRLVSFLVSGRLCWASAGAHRRTPPAAGGPTAGPVAAGADPSHGRGIAGLVPPPPRG
jgi:hypothetical protein